MDFGILLPVLFILLITGAASGFLAGLLGVGGGVIIVPGMFLLLTTLGYTTDIATHVAIGTSLAVMFFGTLSSSLAHARHSAVDSRIIKTWSPWVILGVAAAIILADLINGAIITWIFATFLMCISAYLGFARDLRQKTGFTLPESLQPIIGFSIGGFSALLGIGGAMLSVPSMLMFKVPVHQAIGTAPIFGAIIALFGSLGSIYIGWNVDGLPPYSIGYVSLAALVSIAPISFAMAPVGARLIHRLPIGKLQQTFAFILFLVACYLFYVLIYGINHRT